MKNPRHPGLDTGALNLAACTHFVAGLAAAGVRDVVISPGSRSTPLTLTCLRHPTLRCEIVLDERSAAYFALGIARATNTPVALVCTSGTAAANWLPAVIEAARSLVPLLLCTADRPPELQDWDANQTIDQTGLFGTHVRAFHAPGAPAADVNPAWLGQLAAKVATQARWPRPGPVHVNLAFREPLLPANDRADTEFPEFPASTPVACGMPTLTPADDDLARLAQCMVSPRGLILCGEGPYREDFAAAVTRLAAQRAVPIIAEPLSGLRFGGHDRRQVCTRYAHWLADEAGNFDWVLRFGRFPVTRLLQSSLMHIPTHLLVDRFGRWPDAQHRTTLHVLGDEAAVCAGLIERQPGITGGSDVKRLCAIDAALAAPEGCNAPPEARLLAALCATLPDGARLFCGNSLPIRDLDACSGSGANSLSFFANRGASGIDGNIATAAGIARSGPTVAVIGDLTTQHDLGSLALLQAQALVVIVINNGGGGIFDLLPQARLPEFERAWLTPQQLDFRHAAAAFGIDYHATDATADAVRAATMALAARQSLLIEFSADRLTSLQIRLQQSGR